MPGIKCAFFLALCYFLFTFGYIVSTGFYHVGELAILLTVTIILFAFYFKPQILSKINIPDDTKTLSLFLAVIMLANIAQVGARLGDPAQTNWQFYSAANL